MAYGFAAFIAAIVFFAVLIAYYRGGSDALAELEPHIENLGKTVRSLSNAKENRDD